MIHAYKKWLVLIAAAFIGVSSMSVSAAKGEVIMKPFILGSTAAGDVASKVADAKKALEGNGFEIAGEYTPYDNATIIIVTNDALKNAGATHERGGYVAAQRVAVTKMGDQVQVSYTNPIYMAAAYHVKTDLSGVNNSLKAALGAIKEFGPEKGKTADDLEGYHYTFGMEYFDEPYELNSFKSQSDAVGSVEKGLAKHAGDTTKVYRIDIPGGKQSLFGVGLTSAKNKYADDKFIMSEIDFKEVRSTAHLPYEMLVTDGKVEALHARFRIAVNFPDLSMMGSNSFMNIMPTPDAIKNALSQAAGSKAKDDF